ncbi:MAG: RluA family pseudouridine synthase [Flavobacteriales bacterium]|jgi:23S rRNA pseudouridine1911/1915/1917 synthase|uniref:RluA family pseudouridine synthase n=1 Tax=Blattabacterium sp. (Mastotermes darwiniensis) TaxID=39768 RepID=UPI000231DED5|nr:RluA family pseudouridine synthase [Blattabacterium sp. (Mastotermes darwiniensis)]AER40777.1 ribosomal large subunit pseudouridine synthase D [Blattabacterium sp. (Mastotermes darwiniensis) str. MADAR]MDR1804622.1 RluA family pseudouridine synthase [Flavobacteriales bacterium]
MSLKKFSFSAEKHQKSIRIDKFLRQYIQNVSRNKIQKAVYSGKILVNQRIIKKKNYKIKPFDFIEAEIYSYSTPIVVVDSEYRNIIAERIPLNIIHEDEDILVINKPAGMVVHPGFGNEKGTLIHGVKYHLKNNKELYRLGLVHRIDKDTSGLLVLAKNEQAQKCLFQQFISKTIKRKYIALVWGNLQKEKGTITGFIGRDPKNRKRMTVLKKDFDRGKYSITHYKVLERFKYLTYVSCNLETGKKHQIRAHFKYLGHPLFNDFTYGGNKIIMKKNISRKHIEILKKCLNILKQQALHAISISFIHPSNRKCHFTCPIPKDWKKLIQECREKFLY